MQRPTLSIVVAKSKVNAPGTSVKSQVLSIPEAWGGTQPPHGPGSPHLVVFALCVVLPHYIMAGLCTSGTLENSTYKARS